MAEIGKMMVVAGLLLAAAGAVLWLSGGKWPARLLPGDIAYEKNGTQVYFPVVTCLVISLVFTLVSWLLRKH
jgi:hypothetical protein